MNAAAQRGFSLVELSIVLVIIGALAGTAVIPLTTSIRQTHYKQTNRQLQSIREAMHGYLVSNGKLPCPVDITSDNAVAADIPNPCILPAGGVPAAELGVMGERAANGALLDRWGRPIQYAVSMTDNKELGTSGFPDWLSAGEPGTVGAEKLLADLQLCRKAVSSGCVRKDLIADQIVWVIYSLGEGNDKNGIQAENQDEDTVFAVSAYSINVDQPFDDQVIWASRSELVYWLLRANWLP